MILTDRLITAPATEPVTLAEVKDSSRIDGAEFDGQIAALISSAREMAEHQTGRRFVAQTWRAELDDWTDNIALPQSPVQSIAALQYWDGAAWQTLDGTQYKLVTDCNDRASLARRRNVALPSLADDVGARVRVDYVAGYESAPASAKHWIIAQCGYWLANPQAANERAMEPAPFLDGLLDPLRSWS